jgi:cytochrome P450
MLLLTLSLIVVSLILFYYLCRRHFSSSQDIPGLRPQLFFGNLLQTNILGGEAFVSVWSRFQLLYGDIFAFYWFLNERSVVFNKIEHVEIIYKNRHIFDMSEFVGGIFRFFTKSGLICIKGEQYKRHARLLLPFFKYATAKKHLDVIVQCTDEQLLAKWRRRADEHQAVCSEVKDYIRTLCTQITLTVVFGNDCKQETMDSLVTAANDCLECLGIELPGILFDLNYELFNRQYKRSFTFLHNYTKQKVQHEQLRQRECGDDEESNSFLSFLLERNSSTATLSENELVEEIILFILTGYESVTSAVSWFIFHMSKHPEIQRRIKDELRDHSITQTTQLTVELLEKLNYVDCVLKEVLRYSPVLPTSSRTVTEDTVLDGVQLRKGDSISIAIQNIHRDPRYWKVDPQLLCPERFLSEDKDHHPYAFLAFGGGHRQCAGQGLARVMMKGICVRLMQFVSLIDEGDENGNSGGYLVQLMCFPKNVAVSVQFDEDDRKQSDLSFNEKTSSMC